MDQSGEPVIKAGHLLRRMAGILRKGPQQINVRSRAKRPDYLVFPVGKKVQTRRLLQLAYYGCNSLPLNSAEIILQLRFRVILRIDFTDGVENRGVIPGIIAPPGGEESTWFEQLADLGIFDRGLHPVKGGRCGDQIAGCRGCKVFKGAVDQSNSRDMA